MRFTQGSRISFEPAAGPPLSAISEHAQQQLGDIVFVDLPELGAKFKKGDAGGGGRERQGGQRRVRARLRRGGRGQLQAHGDSPSLVNEDAQGEGWLFKLKLADPAEAEGLMDADAYAEYLKTIA